MFTFFWSRPPTAFITCCSNVKLWLNADSCMNNISRPCKHISLMSPSHIFIVGLYTSWQVAWVRHFECLQGSTVFCLTETTRQSVTETTQPTKCDRNNASETIVVSVTARSRLVTALYTVEKKPPTSTQLHRSNTHRFCLLYVVCCCLPVGGWFLYHVVDPYFNIWLFIRAVVTGDLLFNVRC